MKVSTSDVQDIAKRTISTMHERAKKSYHAPILPGTSITDIQKLAMKLAGKSPGENIKPQSEHNLTPHHMHNHQTRAMWARSTNKPTGKAPAWR